MCDAAAVDAVVVMAFQGVGHPLSSFGAVADAYVASVVVAFAAAS